MVARALLLSASSALVGFGCGLRTDPLSESLIGVTDFDPGEDGGGDDGSNRVGSCGVPHLFPLEATHVAGALEGRGAVEGWCGEDRGPEDVYRLSGQGDVDVTIRFDAAETDFEPVLRVREGGCATDEGTTPLCATEADEFDHHFLALAGKEYTIAVDSAGSVSSGRYAFDVVYGWPTLDQCWFHDARILQEPGSMFTWSNTLSSGQGKADGRCGGPGTENLFPMTIAYPGYVRAVVYGYGGLSPLLGIRTSCAGVSELTCGFDVSDTSFASLEYFVDTPGEYYLTVDQRGVDGGSYDLSVWFD